MCQLTQFALVKFNILNFAFSPLVFGPCGIIATGWFLRTLPRVFPFTRKLFKEQLSSLSVLKTYHPINQELKDLSIGKDQSEVSSN